MRWNIQNAEGKCERRKQSREGTAAREMGRERTNGIDQDEGAGKAEQHLWKVEEREELIKEVCKAPIFRIIRVPHGQDLAWA